MAQSTPPGGVTIPPSIPERIEQITPRPEEPPQPTTPTPQPTLPPLQAPTPSQPGIKPPSNDLKFPVKEIQTIGNTILTKEIEQLKQAFLRDFSKGATFEDLIQLRSRITQLYISNGYITSGAFLLNNQTFDPKVENIVKIQIIEGGLERLEISGLRRLPEGYVASRLAGATRAPLNQERLRNALLLLQLDPLFNRVNAELTAGSSPDRAILRVSLEEAQLFHAELSIDNYQSPSVGSLQSNVFLEHNNLVGLGDRITAEYGRTGGLNLYGASYTIPLSPSNTTLNLRYSNNRSKITEAPFDDLGIRSRSETISVALRQPIVRQPQREFAIGLGLDLRRSRTFLLDDIPFSFSEGSEEGRSKVTAIRFFQDWTDRSSPTRVLAARSQFSFGIDAFGATVNDSGTDAKFFSWLGQFQWVQQLTRTPNSPVLISRLNAQLTPNSLLSLERFSIGGAETLRGYRQNQLVTDNGVNGLIELRVPVTRNPATLQLKPFFEFGAGWNNRAENPDPKWLTSIGLGLQWQVIPSLIVQLDYGIPLIKVVDEGNTLQDKGFYFSVRYRPF